MTRAARRPASPRTKAAKSDAPEFAGGKSWPANGQSAVALRGGPRHGWWYFDTDMAAAQEYAIRFKVSLDHPAAWALHYQPLVPDPRLPQHFEANPNGPGVGAVWVWRPRA